MALVAAILCAACGRGDADADAGKTGTAAADTAAADSSAMGIARSVLGPQVAMALPFTIGPRDARFIAAAIPVMEWVEDPARSGNSVAPGGHELVILELRGGSWAVHKPGLYATREPFSPRLDDTARVTPVDSATLSRMMGVEDVDGDTIPDVWTASYERGTNGYVWEMRAFNRDRRILYTAVLRGVWKGEGLDTTDFTFSESAERNPAARQWLVRKGTQIDSTFIAERRQRNAQAEAEAGSAKAAGAPR